MTTFQELIAVTPIECAEMNPDYWFADPHDEEEKFGNSERAIALSVCGRCPIKLECFRYAIDEGIEEGVWGAAIPQQRRAYRNKKMLGIRAAEQKYGKK